MNAYQLAPSSTPFVHLPPRCFLRPSQYVTLPVHSSAAAHSAFASSPDEARCGGRASEIARAEAALGARRGLLSRQLRPCAPSDSAVRLIVPPLPPAQGCQGCGENPPRLPPPRRNRRSSAPLWTRAKRLALAWRWYCPPKAAALMSASGAEAQASQNSGAFTGRRLRRELLGAAFWLDLRALRLLRS